MHKKTIVRPMEECVVTPETVNPKAWEYSLDFLTFGSVPSPDMLHLQGLPAPSRTNQGGKIFVIVPEFRECAFKTQSSSCKFKQRLVIFPWSLNTGLEMYKK